ncbi:FAD-dependent monooxygenase [Streptomyces cadmiisoli]|uniref:3-hydroxybenzoate 6-hydroxylase n=1 Tax=Streptomyces cadmiisoli TaxID=2184053 RepID=A0A2Z4J942_9ACTN|nr:FAD-dependent monooxygenase [Streptomyces cadmiisoli]AWW41569.1 3-hydroxybenzoate 6-hydroxylase [Streptomyces cadmiisoli]
MNTHSEVLVVGGGIGGLAVAHNLARSGYGVRLLERADHFGEVGAGLQLAPNATRLLRDWGLLDAVVERGVLPDRLVLRDAVDGRLLTSLDLGDEFRRRYQAPYVVVHRSDLHDVLLTACREAGVELLTGHEVTDVRPHADRAEIMCADGSGFTADVALGLDGVDSGLRGTLVADEKIDSGFVAYRGTMAAADAPDTVDLRSVVAWLGPDCHLVQYPLRRGELVNQVAVFRVNGEPGALDAVFAACCPAVRAGLGALWRDRHWPMTDRLPTTGWSQGRLGILGDAAHPMLQYLAQGACQALEDAQVFTDQAVKHSADWPAALEATERIRAPRTARIQRTARVWGEIWHVDGTARLLRNELLRTRAAPDRSHIDWLYGV